MGPTPMFLGLINGGISGCVVRPLLPISSEEGSRGKRSFLPFSQSFIAFARELPKCLTKVLTLFDIPLS
jgi:hypothetical protein